MGPKRTDSNTTQGERKSTRRRTAPQRYDGAVYQSEATRGRPRTSSQSKRRQANAEEASEPGRPAKQPRKGRPQKGKDTSPQIFTEGSGSPLRLLAQTTSRTVSVPRPNVRPKYSRQSNAKPRGQRPSTIHPPSSPLNATSRSAIRARQNQVTAPSQSEIVRSAVDTATRLPFDRDYHPRIIPPQRQDSSHQSRLQNETHARTLSNQFNQVPSASATHLPDYEDFDDDDNDGDTVTPNRNDRSQVYWSCLRCPIHCPECRQCPLPDHCFRQTTSIQPYASGNIGLAEPTETREDVHLAYNESPDYAPPRELRMESGLNAPRDSRIQTTDEPSHSSSNVVAATAQPSQHPSHRRIVRAEDMWTPPAPPRTAYPFARRDQGQNPREHSQHARSTYVDQYAHDFHTISPPAHTAPHGAPIATMVAGTPNFSQQRLEPLNYPSPFVQGELLLQQPVYQPTAAVYGPYTSPPAPRYYQYPHASHPSPWARQAPGPPPTANTFGATTTHLRHPQIGYWSPAPRRRSPITDTYPNVVIETTEASDHETYGSSATTTPRPTIHHELSAQERRGLASPIQQRQGVRDRRVRFESVRNEEDVVEDRDRPLTPAGGTYTGGGLNYDDEGASQLPRGYREQTPEPEELSGSSITGAGGDNGSRGRTRRSGRV